MRPEMLAVRVQYDGGSPAQSGFDGLPGVVIAVVCRFLGPRELGRLACVSRRFTETMDGARWSPIEEGARLRLAAAAADGDGEAEQCVEMRGESACLTPTWLRALWYARELAFASFRTHYDATFAADHVRLRRLQVAGASAKEFRDALPRLLAELCDFHLRKGISETVEPNDALTCAVTVYSYLEYASHFNQFNTRLLANRLLHDTTVGVEEEERFLQMIEQRCGATWTRQQRAMIQDMNASDSKHEAGFEAFRTRDAGGAAFARTAVTVRLLDEQIWPLLSPHHKLPAPAALQQVIDGFERYCESQQFAQDGAPQVQLNWLLTQGGATVKPVYGGKKRGFMHKALRCFRMEVANPYMLAILLLFNEQDRWTVPQLAAQLNIEMAVLKPYVDALAMKQPRALRACIVDPSVASEEADFSQLAFEVNQNLPREVVDSRTRKARPVVRWDMISSCDATQQVAEAVELEVMEERRFVIDAYIVRVMKPARSMHQAELITELCTIMLNLPGSAGFEADRSFVRARIEHMTDAEFLRRDEADPRLLLYVA